MNSGTTPGPHIKRVDVRGQVIVIVYDEPTTTTYDNSPAPVERLRELLRPLRTFAALPRRHIPWSALQVWPQKLTCSLLRTDTRWNLSASGIGEGRKAARNV